MSTFTESARGASAYTYSDYPRFQPLDESGFFRSDDVDTPTTAWSRVVDELLRIRNMENNWDGEGTDAPHPALVDGAITLAKTLQAKGVPPSTRVHVSVNGTIYFEWHTPLGYGEIEVFSPVDAECRWVRKGADKTEVVVLSCQS